MGSERRSKLRDPSRIGALRAIVLTMAISSPCGCGKKSDVGPNADPAASASAPTQEDPLAKKPITKEICAAFAAHAVAVVLADVKLAAAGCPAEKRESVVGEFEGRRIAMRDGAVAVCERHLGETYVVGGGQCYLRAKNAKELTACKFAPLTNEGDSDLDALIGGIASGCGRPGAPAVSAASAASKP
jgi:hypothetical protein